MGTAIDLYHKIWKDRNSFLHGISQQEAKIKLQVHEHEQVHQVYQHPPQLHRFSEVLNVPLLTRLKCTTTNLQQWLSCISTMTLD